MRIVCISDTHGVIPPMEIPDGDVLIHAGDITNIGKLWDVTAFNDWIGALPHKHKVVIAGNHDWCFERDDQARKLLTNCTYLQDEQTVIDGLVFYGSPWQPRFLKWAFNLDDDIKDKWAMIPDNTDILITHGPPHGTLDKTADDGLYVGCKHMKARITDLDLKLHVFGHIHEGYGRRGNAVNASMMTLRYAPVNKPIVVDV
jgi:Icc-related predicted phosphoesterase